MGHHERALKPANSRLLRPIRLPIGTMTAPSLHDVTQLLLDWSDGDKAALDRLMPLVYGELRRLAHHHMRREYAGHTLQTTALVNEVYLKLIDQNSVHWQNSGHFFAIAARLMQMIIGDYARSRQIGEAPRAAGASHA